MSCLRSLARALVSVLSLALVAIPTSASAQEEAKTILSLEDALAMAERRAPEVVLARHARREAGARRVGAGVVMPYNPRVQVDARPPITGGPVFPLGTIADLGYAVVVEAPFEVGGAPRARVREAERYAELSQAQLALEQRRARFDTWAAYVRIQVAEQRIAAARASAEIVGRIVAASKQRADLGASGDIEQSLASSDLAQIEALLLEATRERDVRVMELRDVLDLPTDQRIELTTQLGEPEAPVAADALVARALATRPELGVVRRRIDLLDATQDRLKKETFPRISIFAGVDAAPISPIFGVLGLSVELPVAQRNAGPRAVTQAARDGEAERLALLGRRISREVTAARNAFDARRGELDALTNRALPTAERTLELVEIGWRSGRFDIFRVATAARDVTRVRALRLDALEAAWLERISLERAAGAQSGATR